MPEVPQPSMIPQTPPDASLLERVFKLRANNTTFFREMLGGVVTFMTMSYIILVNPTILGNTGMDTKGVMLATCLATGLTTLLMAFWANYPIALAPGMGLNAYFAFNICLGAGVSWQVALVMVVVSGLVFLAISFTGLRIMIAKAVPDAVKYGAAVGIGLFIAFIGLQKAGIVVHNSATMVTLGSVKSDVTLVALSGLGFMILLMALRIPGAILLGIIGTGVVAYFFNILPVTINTAKDVIAVPPFEKLPGLKVGFSCYKEVFTNIRIYWHMILVLLYFDMFDTLGTLMGVGEAGGMMVNGQLPRAKQAMQVDAFGTVLGGLLGTSTVTSYIESASGIASGARTGLANIPTALLFIGFAFLSPLADKVMGYSFITAPALIVVGALMMSAASKVNWNDFTEGFPAFLTMIVMPLTFSISHGLAIGFIAYALCKLFSGRIRGTHWLMYVLAALFAAYFVFVVK
ncbi:MAG: NCS2 family permease [Planctomycetota bacterium]|nr:NCS2 family permease [Planctomycetota bacterium]